MDIINDVDEELRILRGEAALVLIGKVINNQDLAGFLKNKVLSVVLYLTKEEKNYEIANRFYDFIIEMINKKDNLLELKNLIDSILTRINDDKLLIDKLDVISRARMDELGFDSKTFFEVLNDILNMSSCLNFSNNVKKMLIDFIENPVPSFSSDDDANSFRTEIVLDYIIYNGRNIFFTGIKNDSDKRKINIDSSYEWTSEVLRNKMFSKIDEEHYQKLLVLSCQGSFVYFIHKYLLNKDYLSKECIESIIDYYYKVFSNYYVKHHDIQSVSELDLLDSIPLFNIVGDVNFHYPPYNSFMSDLAFISSSDYPFSMAEFIKNGRLKNVDDGYLYLVTDKITAFGNNAIGNDKKIWGKGLSNHLIYRDDCKTLVAKAAYSEVLLAQPVKKRIEVIDFLNNVCINGNIIRNQRFNRDGIDYFHSYDSKYYLAKKLVDILDASIDGSNIYMSEFDRIEYLIDKIKAYEDTKDNDELSFENGLKYAIEFAGSSISSYYSLEQFKMIVDMIAGCSNLDDAQLLLALFTNKCVPYMDDEDFNNMLSFWNADDSNRLDTYCGLACSYNFWIDDDTLNSFKTSDKNGKVRHYISLANNCGNKCFSEDKMFEGYSEEAIADAKNRLRGVGYTCTRRLKRRNITQKI